MVKGLSLVTLYYTDVQGRSLPVNYRVGLMFAVEANRTVSVDKRVWVQVQRLKM